MSSFTAEEHGLRAVDWLHRSGFEPDPKSPKPAMNELPDKTLIGGGVVLRRGTDRVYYGTSPAMWWRFYVSRDGAPWQWMPGSMSKMIERLRGVLS